MHEKMPFILLLLVYLTGYSQSVNSINTKLASCVPTYSYGCAYGEGISGFEFDSKILSNNSGCSANNYGTFTNIIPTIVPGSTYQFNVTLLSGVYPEGVSIWIDLNRNYTFESSERLFSNDNFLDNISGSVTIPFSTTSGPLKVRVVTRFSNAPNDACGQYDFGETEDYQLSVVTMGCSMYSLKNGYWNDISTWSCNRLPTIDDYVQISHILTIPPDFTAKAFKIKYDTGARVDLSSNAKLSLGK